MKYLIALLTAIFFFGASHVQADQNVLLFSDSFDVITMDHSDINHQIERRQSGSLAPKKWAAFTKRDGASVLVDDGGTNALVVCNGGSARLIGLPLSSANVSGPLTISFHVEDKSDKPTSWTSFSLTREDDLANFHGNLVDLICGPAAESGGFGFLYRANTGIQLCNNNNIFYELNATSGGKYFSFTFTGADGSGSAFDGNGTTVNVKNGTNVIGRFTLDSGLTTNYIAFASFNGTPGASDAAKNNTGYISNLKVVEITTPGSRTTAVISESTNTPPAGEPSNQSAPNPALNYFGVPVHQ